MPAPMARSRVRSGRDRRARARDCVDAAVTRWTRRRRPMRCWFRMRAGHTWAGRKCRACPAISSIRQSASACGKAIETADGRYGQSKSFLRRFRGVTYKHLGSYLRWFQQVELSGQVSPRCLLGCRPEQSVLCFEHRAIPIESSQTSPALLDGALSSGFNSARESKRPVVCEACGSIWRNRARIVRLLRFPTNPPPKLDR